MKIEWLITHVTAARSPTRANTEDFEHFPANSGRFYGSLGQFVIHKLLLLLTATFIQKDVWAIF